MRKLLLMNFKFDELLFVKNILNLYFSHLRQRYISVALKILPVYLTYHGLLMVRDKLLSNHILVVDLVALVRNDDVFVRKSVGIGLSLVIYEYASSPNRELFFTSVKGESMRWVPIAKFWP